MKNISWTILAISPWLVFFSIAGPHFSAGHPSCGPAAPTVVVQSVVDGPVESPSENIGRVEALEAVDVRARVSGFIEEVAFSPGAAVAMAIFCSSLSLRSMKLPSPLPRRRSHVPRQPFTRPRIIETGTRNLSDAAPWRAPPMKRPRQPLRLQPPTLPQLRQASRRLNSIFPTRA